jgi:hypothetical protein
MSVIEVSDRSATAQRRPFFARIRTRSACWRIRYPARWAAPASVPSSSNGGMEPASSIVGPDPMVRSNEDRRSIHVRRDRLALRVRGRTQNAWSRGPHWCWRSTNESCTLPFPRADSTSSTGWIGCAGAWLRRTGRTAPKSFCPQKMGGKIINQGSLRLSKDGRNLVEEFWNPNAPNQKATLVLRQQARTCVNVAAGLI